MLLRSFGVLATLVCPSLSLLVKKETTAQLWARIAGILHNGTVPDLATDTSYGCTDHCGIWSTVKRVAENYPEVDYNFCADSSTASFNDCNQCLRSKNQVGVAAGSTVLVGAIRAAQDNCRAPSTTSSSETPTSSSLVPSTTRTSTTTSAAALTTSTSITSPNTGESSSAETTLKTLPAIGPVTTMRAAPGAGVGQSSGSSAAGYATGSVDRLPYSFRWMIIATVGALIYL